MAVTSSGDGNFSSVITGGLTVNDDVIINHDVTMDGHAPNVNSLVINSGKTLTGGGYKITIDSENSSGFAVDNDGIISGNLDLEINTPATTQIDLNGSSGNFRDVKLNDASVDARLAENTTIGRNLTIAAGELNTSGSNYSLTVTGKTSISSGTLTLNNSVVLLGTTSTSDYGLTMSGGACNMGGSDCKTGAVNISGGALTPTSATWEVMSAYSSNAWISVPSSFTNQGTLKFTSPLGGNIRTPQGMNDVIFDASSGTPTWTIITQGFQCVNLTITDGTLDTGSDYGLTVTGEVNIASGATLTCNSSVCSFGSLHSQGTANLADASGSTLITNEDGDGLSIIAGTFSNCVPSTIKHNNGTVTFNNHSDPADHAAIVIGVSTSTDGLYNVIIDGANTIVDTYQPSGGSQHCTIFNDFTVTNGNFRVNSASNLFTVLGNVTVNGGNMFNTSAAPTAAHSFGSLRVVSGATFKATSGTTTLSKEADTGGTDFMFHNDGTFTHNNGKFVFDDAGLSSSSNVRCSSSFYDVELTMGSFSLTSHHNMNVANDFTVTTGTYSDGSNGFTITGDVSVANGATLNLSNSSTQTKTLGSISVASGGTFRACRGTTTITKANGGTDGRAFFIHGSATFTHNDGLVKFTASSPQVAPTSSGQTSTSHPFYDLEQTTGTMQWKAEHHKVLNNCTMQGSAFNGSTGNVHVLGICRLTGETFNSGDTATNDNNFFQTLVIESGATVDLSAIDITVGSLRNLGGTIQ